MNSPPAKTETNTDITNDNETTVPFHCSMCGECCSSISIPIEAKKAEVLLKKEWVQARLEETHRSLDKATKTLYRLPLTDSNSCVFLDTDGLCLIEKNEGPDLKPEECYNYPFAGIKAPNSDENLYDASASCKHIAEELLLKFKRIVPLGNHTPRIHDNKLPKKIKTYPWHSIPTQIWFDATPALERIFNQPDTDPHPEECLKQAQEHILSLHKKEEKPPTKEGFRLVPSARRYIELRHLRHPYGMVSFWQLLQERHFDDPRIFGLQVPLVPSKERQAFTWEAGSYRRVNAFLFHILQRRVLLTYGHTLTGLLGISVTALVVIQWYSAMLASLDDRTRITIADTALAIRLTERYYTGHQPLFLDRFQYGSNAWLLQKWALKQ